MSTPHWFIYNDHSSGSLSLYVSLKINLIYINFLIYYLYSIIVVTNRIPSMTGNNFKKLKK